MIHDSIVEEVHQTRERLLAKFNGDLHALCDSVRRATEDARLAGKVVYPATPRAPLAVKVTNPAAKKVG